MFGRKYKQSARWEMDHWQERTRSLELRIAVLETQSLRRDLRDAGCVNVEAAISLWQNRPYSDAYGRQTPMLWLCEHHDWMFPSPSKKETEAPACCH
jgi:hypothetical protein